MQKTVLITGCSTGLGNTAAQKFASEGWNVITAACDKTDRLRYPSGPDAEKLINLRWSQSDENYMAAMRDFMGHTKWRNSIKNKI